MSRPQAQKLRDAGIATIASLAALPDDARVPRVAPATVAKLRRQAALQLARRSGGAPVVEQLDMEDGRGFAALPPPDSSEERRVGTECVSPFRVRLSLGH